jgi:hypothetical protein
MILFGVRTIVYCCVTTRPLNSLALLCFDFASCYQLFFAYVIGEGIFVKFDYKWISDDGLCWNLQAVCKDKIFPYIHIFATGYGKADEPRRAYVLANVIALACVCIGKFIVCLK